MAFKLSGFADEYSMNLSEQIKGFKLLGIDNLELRFIDGVNVSKFTEEQVENVKTELEKAGIGVSAIGSPIGKINLNDDFDEHLALAEKVFKTANTLGVKYIRMFSFYLDGRERDDCFEEVVERIGALLDLADKYGVILCHENEAKIYGESPEYCLKLLEHFGGRLRAVFDMGNFLLDGYKPLECGYKLLKDYIEYFHIKDATIDKVIVPCGEGDADIQKIFATFKADFPERDVFISLEPHLVDFVGLKSLAASELKQKLTFKDDKEAFTYAFNNLKKLLSEI